jgi:NADPH:quinone reductase-like Zn-dependent oxidoreductase/nitrite reductase/ring-hydroxylating ferredoxin subunit
MPEPVGWTPVIAEAELPVGKATQVLLGDLDLFVYRIVDRIFVLDDQCSHEGGPLHRGKVNAHIPQPTVTCPIHGSAFWLTDGRVIRPPASRPQPVYDVRVTDGVVEVRPRSAEWRSGPRAFSQANLKSGGTLMRAYAIDEFGQKGSVRELETPEPGEGEVLLRVHAAGVNPFDSAVVNGYVKDYMDHRFPLIPGMDVSGTVEAIGPGVDGFAVGDEVYGIAQKPFQGAGSFAEYVTAPADSVAAKPASVDHRGAASLPLAALTALTAVEAVDPGEGKAILIVGATGGVGSFATQLASRAGARVVAVARGKNADYARSLGASDVIDYTAGDLVDLVRTSVSDGLDAVIDLAGDAAVVTRLADLVHPGGRVVSAAGAADADALEQRGLRGGQVSRAGLDRLGELAGLIDSSRLRLSEIRTYALDQAGEALDEQGTSHVRGKLVIDVG